MTTQFQPTRATTANANANTGVGAALNADLPHHLATCLDTAAMRPLLAAALGRQVLALRLSDVRRNTSHRRNPHPLMLCYDAELAGPSGPEMCRLSARLCRDQASAQALRDSQALLVPGLPLLLWRWPVDPGLPQLPTLLDPAQARPWCGASASAVVLLRHVAGQRAVLCHQLPQPLQGGGTGALQLWAKTFDDDRGAAIAERFQHFWRLSQQQPGAPMVARTLGYSAATHTLWQAGAPGQPLLARLQTGLAVTPGLADRIARAWLAVHQAPLHLAGSAPRDSAHWCHEVARRCRKLARAQPALAARSAQLQHSLLAAAQALPEAPPVLIHGDCHPAQLWLHGDRVVLFDFDEFQQGDAMEDLAQFITKLAPQGPQAALAAALPKAYAAAAPALFHPQRLRWHGAVQQLLQAARAFGFQRPGWPLEMDARLAQAQALADACMTETPA